MKNKLLALLVLCMAFNSCEKEEKTNNEEKVTTQTPVNYVKKGAIYSELNSGKIAAGLYDGGPKYYISIFLNNSNVTFIQDDDDVSAFSGIGTGTFMHILTTDSLENGSFIVNEGWVGFNNFNFNSPDTNIYNMNNLPSNFLYIEDYQVSFSKTDSIYDIEIKNNDIEIKYSGALDFL